MKLFGKHFLIAAICLPLQLWAQRQNEAASENNLDKIDVFASKKGTMIKFRDTKLSPIKLAYSGVAETRIRKFSSGGSSAYFYQIESKGQYRSEVGSIAFEDLLELIKALDALQTELPNDLAQEPDYLENKYITDDGLRLGYLVARGKATWYIALDDRGSDNTIFINDPALLRSAFAEAKSKIEEMTR